MHSVIVILVLLGVSMGAPQQPGYNIQAPPPSNSLRPGLGGGAITQPQSSFGTSGPPANNGGGVSLGSVTGNAGQIGVGGGNAFGGGNAGQIGVSGGNAFGGGNAGQIGVGGGNAFGGINAVGGGNAGQFSAGGGNAFGGGNAGQFQQPAASPVRCAADEVLHVDGKCVKPIISRNIFVYAAPAVPQQVGPAPVIPNPKVEYNIVFVRTPEAAEGAEPIIVPPPQQKTLVYVLSKKGGALGPQIIEVPAGPDHQPEVYYVNYADGENPTLPGGVDLQQALSAAATTGQVIGGGGGAGLVAGAGLGAAGIGSGAGTVIGGLFDGFSTGSGGQSSNGGSFTGPATGGSFVGGSNTGGNFGGSGQGQGGNFVGGSNTGVNFGGSGQGQVGNFVAPSSGGSFASGSPSGGSLLGGSPSGGNFGTTNTGSNFGSSSSSNSFSSSSNTNSFSSNFIGGSQGNGGGFNPSIQQAQAQTSAPQAPSALYNRPN